MNTSSSSNTVVRMLIDRAVEGKNYLCNAVVNFPSALAAQLVKSGIADDAEAAVKYCITELKAVVVEHVDPAIAAVETKTQAVETVVTAEAQKVESEAKGLTEEVIEEVESIVHSAEQKAESFVDKAKHLLGR